jgi:hypothetical protein
MKRKILAIVMALVFIFTLAPTAAVYADEIKVTIDGELVTFTGQQPIIVDGRTLVPVRGVFEALGFEVSWLPETRTVNLQKFGEPNEIERPIIHWVTIRIGSETFNANSGVDRPLDVPAQIINGSTMLPLRAVLESVGYSLDWDGDTRTVIITSDPIVFEHHYFEDLGFAFSTPVSWSGKISISREDFESEIGVVSTVNVRHIATEEAFEWEGSGMLFKIIKFPVYDGWENEPIGQIFAQEGGYVYTADYPQDSPHEYDSTDEIAVQYREMMDELLGPHDDIGRGWDDNFVANSFKLLD